MGKGGEVGKLTVECAEVEVELGWDVETVVEDKEVGKGICRWRGEETNTESSVRW